jgi:tellurite resistance protein
MKLGKDVFMALAAVGWSDDKVEQEEADAIVHAARECGIDGAELDAVKQATQTKVDLSAIKSMKLEPDERLFVYAMATWLARVDGVVMPEEKEALEKLGNVLKLADGDRTKASVASFRVAELADSERPSRYDLAGLAAKLEAPLSKRD